MKVPGAMSSHAVMKFGRGLLEEKRTFTASVTQEESAFYDRGAAGSQAAGSLQRKAAVLLRRPPFTVGAGHGQKKAHGILVLDNWLKLASLV